MVLDSSSFLLSLVESDEKIDSIIFMYYEGL